MTIEHHPQASAADLRTTRKASTGQWAALIAAFLGWMFDGFEMGLFPLIARPALKDLLGSSAAESSVEIWFGIMTAGFLVAAATGGVLFGWLGDRIGRVRAMMLSVATYAVFSGLCGLVTSFDVGPFHFAAVQQLFLSRFIASLGMGGEWSLGVALVMELWPNKSRGAVAAVIGAGSNVGFLAIAICGLMLTKILGSMEGWLHAIGLPQEWVTMLVANSGWRLLMILGAAPALLTFFIRLAVPESERWLDAQKEGATTHWASQDLVVVGLGALGPLLMIYLYAVGHSFGIQLAGTVVGVLIALAGYTYPMRRFLHRSRISSTIAEPHAGATMRRMLLGACLSGVALLGTWGAIQFAGMWVDRMTEEDPQNRTLAREDLHKLRAERRSYTQICGSTGAILGSVSGALLGNAIGRRPTYVILCVAALTATESFFNLNTSFGPLFLLGMFLAGLTSAAFYGWLPLYLPELFPTNVRATGQGFSYNFGRILAAVGALQTGNLTAYFDKVPAACSVICLIYILGVGLIFLAPETHGKPLPE